jgi:hypothetical protein
MHQKAFESFENALQFNPNHEVILVKDLFADLFFGLQQTLFNSAVLIQELGIAKYRPIAYKR